MQSTVQSPVQWSGSATALAAWQPVLAQSQTALTESLTHTDTVTLVVYVANLWSNKAVVTGYGKHGVPGRAIPRQVVLKNFRPRKFFRLRDFTVCIIRCVYRAELILGR